MVDRVPANWPLKVLAIALAFGIWVSVTGEKRIVQDFNVPLDMQLPDNLALLDAPPTTVSVRLRGPESLIRRLDPVVMEMVVALNEMALGDHDVQLAKADMAGVPRGVEVDFIEPDRVRVHLDKRARRSVALEVAFLGQPPDGYVFYGVRVTPEALNVEGPAGQIEGLQNLQTSPIRLDQRKAPFVVTVRALTGHPSLRVVETGPIQVRVDVDAAPIERSFAAVPVETIGRLHETTVSPDRIDVTLAGPPTLIDRLRPAQLRLVADVSGLQPSETLRQVPVRLDLIDVPVEDLARISLKSAGQRRVAVRVTGRRPS